MRQLGIPVAQVAPQGGLGVEGDHLERPAVANNSLFFTLIRLHREDILVEEEEVPHFIPPKREPTISEAVSQVNDHPEVAVAENSREGTRGVVPRPCMVALSRIVFEEIKLREGVFSKGNIQDLSLTRSRS